MLGYHVIQINSNIVSLMLILVCLQLYNSIGEKTLNLLKNYIKEGYNNDRALVLCQTLCFPPGILYLYEVAGLYAPTCLLFSCSHFSSADTSTSSVITWITRRMMMLWTHVVVMETRTRLSGNMRSHISRNDQKTSVVIM